MRKDQTYIWLSQWDTQWRIQEMDELEIRDLLIRHKIKLKRERKHIEAEAVQEYINEHY